MLTWSKSGHCFLSSTSIGGLLSIVYKHTATWVCKKLFHVYLKYNSWKRKQKTVLTLLRPMGYSIKFETVKSGWSIVYIEGLQVIISPKYCISFSKDRFCLSRQCRPRQNCHLMQHFIWLFTVCHSTRSSKDSTYSHHAAYKIYVIFFNFYPISLQDCSY